MRNTKASIGYLGIRNSGVDVDALLGDEDAHKEMREELKDSRTELARLKEDNERLRAEISQLKGDKAALERRLDEWHEHYVRNYRAASSDESAWLGSDGNPQGQREALESLYKTYTRFFQTMRRECGQDVCVPDVAPVSDEEFIMWLKRRIEAFRKFTSAAVASREILPQEDPEYYDRLRTDMERGLM